MLRKALIIFIVLPIGMALSGQKLDNTTALLVIDIQEFYFPGGDMPLYQPEIAAGNAALLIEDARKKGNEVVFVRHNYEPGGIFYREIIPAENEKIFSKDNVNSFLGTGLHQYLEEKGIDELVICGMQTHMCVEAAVRAAADLGYECILIHDACTSRDLKYDEHTISAIDVHLSTLSTLRNYAQIISTEEYLYR